MLSQNLDLGYDMVITSKKYTFDFASSQQNLICPIDHTGKTTVHFFEFILESCVALLLLIRLCVVNPAIQDEYVLDDDGSRTCQQLCRMLFHDILQKFEKLHTFHHLFSECRFHTCK